MNSFPDTISVLYKGVQLSHELVIENIKTISVNKSIMSNLDRRKIFGSNYLALSVNNKYFGNLVEEDLKYKYIHKNFTTSTMHIEKPPPNLPKTTRN